MQLKIHTSDTAPERSVPILDGIATDVGFVPNLAAAIAESPTLLAAFDGMRRAVGACDIEAVHREVAGLAVGVAVDNEYGVAFHSTVLGRLGVSDDEIQQMRDGEPPTDARAAAVYVFARALVRERGKLDVDQMTVAGFSSADVLDVVAECLFASLVGVVDNLVNRVELDAFLQPRAWTR